MTSLLPLPRSDNYGQGYADGMGHTALLVIDMMNTYRHPDAGHLTPSVEKIIDPLARLIKQARQREDIDVIYINDNYGDFTADRQEIVRSALDGQRPDLVQPIVPAQGTRFLTKVRHSAFYSTALGYLLGQLDTNRLILTGQVTEQCILYTALDAYVRHFSVIVPRDVVADIDPILGDAAVKMMSRNMRAEIVTAGDCLAQSPL